MRLAARLVPEEAAVDITHRDGVALTPEQQAKILLLLLLDGVSARLTADGVRLLELAQVDQVDAILDLDEPMDIAAPASWREGTEVAGWR